MCEIEFHDRAGRPGRAARPQSTDAAVEAARAEQETAAGALPPDPRIGYPSFTVYRGGEEVGG